MTLRFVVDYDRKINDVLDEARFGWRAEARLGVFGSGRHELTGEWYKRGAIESDQFRQLTNDLMRGSFGMEVEL